MFPSKRVFPRKSTKLVAAGVAAIAVGGGAYGIVSATASTGAGAASAATSPSTASQFVHGGGGANARSGPAAGGSSGTIESVSKSSFTITTSAGQKVTVKTVSSTTYMKGSSARSASAIARGETVLVFGITSGTTITASHVIVQQTGGGGSTTSSAVVPFQ